MKVDRRRFVWLAAGSTSNKGNIVFPVDEPRSAPVVKYPPSIWTARRAWTKDRQEGERVNVLGTRNVLTTMKELRIPKGVYTSTLAVFSDTHGQLVDETYRQDGKGPWLTEYDRTKWVAHYEVAEPMIREG